VIYRWQPFEQIRFAKIATSANTGTCTRIPHQIASELNLARLARFKLQCIPTFALAQFSQIFKDDHRSCLNLEMFHLNPALFLFILTLSLSFLHRYTFLKYTGRRRTVADFRTATSFLHESDLESRAKANRHLRDAFGILNPFVNGEKDFHNKYVKCVHRQLFHITSDWSALVDCGKSAAKQINETNSVDRIRDGVRVTVAYKILETSARIKINFLFVASSWQNSHSSRSGRLPGRFTSNTFLKYLSGCRLH